MKKNIFQDFKVNNGIEVQELIKKANQYYQKGHIEASILFFNEVLEVEPDNSTAQFFIKIKQEQYAREALESSSDQTQFNSLIVKKDYENAYRVLTELMKKHVDNEVYLELHNILHSLIEYKLKNKLLEKIGDLTKVYIITNKRPGLSADEEQLYLQFKTPSSLKDVMDNSTNKELRVLNIYQKLISAEYIKPYKQSVSNKNALTEAQEMMQIMDNLNNSEKNDVTSPTPITEIQNLNKETDTKNKPITDVVDYDSLYKKAMGFYVRRDYLESLTLFLQCRNIKPDDSRVLHNIEKLKERIN